jgi:hypothetical protein
MFNSRSEFSAAHPGGYKAATKLGHDYMDDVFSHMEDRTPSDRDAVYIWQSVGEYYNGKQVYKLGVTSARLSERRIIQVARNAKIKAKVVVLRKVRLNADVVEGYLLALGDDPQFVGRDGATEFRALDEFELGKAIEIVEHYAEGSDDIDHPAVIDGTIPTSGRRRRDKEIRKWVHHSGEVFMGSRHNAAVKFGVTEGATGSVIRGDRAHVKGWGLNEAPDASKIGHAGLNNARMDTTVYLWVNDDGREEVCTRYDMKVRHDIPSSSASTLVSGKTRQAKGWRVIFLLDHNR